MPIYEYQAVDPEQSCEYCAWRFEVIQSLTESPLETCPRCENPVRKLISWCRAAISQGDDEQAQVAGTLRDYEQDGKWSHAAELADKHSEKTGDSGLKTRALENYAKAGYDVDRLVKD